MLRASMLLAGLVLLAGAAAAQYPDRPIVMIVPFPPGGVADTVARPVAEALGARAAPDLDRREQARCRWRAGHCRCGARLPTATRC
jgi:hypothetical protein